MLAIVDFISAAQTVRVNRETTQSELGLEWLVSFEKRHFNGHRALLVKKERGSRRRLMAVEMRSAERTPRTAQEGERNLLLFGSDGTGAIAEPPADAANFGWRHAPIAPRIVAGPA